MIDINQLLPYYPKSVATNASFHKHILKEYVELLALEFLMQSSFAPKLVFIGGTCLRLVYGIDRFSEDLDFDCKDLTRDEFMQMKLSAMLARAKGRDFYDVLFLWQQTEPDFGFLEKRCGISTVQELQKALDKKLEETNLSDKQKDFRHLLFSDSTNNKVLYFKDFINAKQVLP